MFSEDLIRKAEAGMKESNKILIQELVADLEQKGIFPAITINGKVSSLKIFDAELKKFEKILDDNGFGKKDFCLMIDSNVDDSLPRKDIKKHVFIVDKKTGRIKKYSLKTWDSSILRDINKKKFFYD